MLSDSERPDPIGLAFCSGRLLNLDDERPSALVSRSRYGLRGGTLGTTSRMPWNKGTEAKEGGDGRGGMMTVASPPHRVTFNILVWADILPQQWLRGRGSHYGPLKAFLFLFLLVLFIVVCF